MVITEDHCFYPDHFVYFDPARSGLNHESIWIQDRLHCWFIQPKKTRSKPVSVVHLHGNAENMTSHIIGATFLLDMGYHLFTFDYSGYGQSRGKPTLAGIQQDAMAVFQHILERPQKFGSSVFGFGQSMGAYALARILPEIPALKGAILEAGLFSFYNLFSQAYPHIKCTIPNDGYSALDTLPSSSVPKLFIHGTHDLVVPHAHSEKMFGVAAQPKEIMILQGVGHIEAFASTQSASYTERIESFVEKNAEKNDQRP
ncbi:MAG: alpha/beta hydrolase [Deltaproteobacteria bacterium]|nr:alpha/beta hydrolase [Deltaproteobacteria bacterium]